MDSVRCFLTLFEVVDLPVVVPRRVLAALAELYGGSSDSVLRRLGVQFLDKVGLWSGSEEHRDFTAAVH